MKASLTQRLDRLKERLEEVTELLSSSEATDNMEEFRKLTKEHAELQPIVETYNAYQEAESNLQAAEEMISDPEMKSLAQEEISHNKALRDHFSEQLKILLLPKDEDDQKNVVLEIRAGTGGDEASLFAADLFRLYSKYAEKKGWHIDLLSATESDVGGYKEIIALIEGDNIYKALKFESGGHRVQRIPQTESQGRIHTSSCTVAIMPEADQIKETQLNPNDLKIDTFRASGAGGQHINKTDSAVRITHLPTGLVVECQDGRSQHSNKAQALKVLAARLYDKQKSEAHAKEAAERKSLIGSGERSERIRSYNYPQGRVSDHRINLTLYKLDQIMEGNLEELIQPLQLEYQAEQLSRAEENN